MHRFHLSPDLCKGTQLTLTGSEAHHAANVLRLRPGASVSVLDGAGKVLGCEVDAVSKCEVHLRVVKIESVPALPYRLTLLLAVPKGKLIDSIIQKATELGVARIVPLLSERVVTHLDDDGAEAKAAKWQQIAVEATKQCGQAWPHCLVASTAICCHLAALASAPSSSRCVTTRSDNSGTIRATPSSVAFWMIESISFPFGTASSNVRRYGKAGTDSIFTTRR